MKKILLLPAILLAASCAQVKPVAAPLAPIVVESPTPIERQRTVKKIVCDPDVATQRAEYIFTCLKESSGSLLRECEVSAERTFCQKVTIIIDEICTESVRCRWREIGREVR